MCSAALCTYSAERIIYNFAILENLRIFQNCPFTRNRFQYGLDCIYTAGNENVCRKYRKMAEMLHAALHFAVKSSKV